MFYLSTLTPNEFDELSFTMSPWRFAVLAACIAFVEGKPHQMPKMLGGALASWGCWKAGKRQRRARDLGRGDHEIWWDAMPISSMYGIYANIGGILMINVTIYSIHGSYGMGMNGNIMRVFEGMQWDYNQLWVFLGLSKNKGSPPPHLHLLGKNDDRPLCAIRFPIFSLRITIPYIKYHPVEYIRMYWIQVFIYSGLLD